MPLVYKNQFINDPREKAHAVLDMQNSDFKDEPTLTYGYKTAPTYAFRGQPGLKVVTSQTGNIETFYECKSNEVVFVNVLPDGKLDCYVPRDKDEKPTGEDILKTSYVPVSGDLNSPGGGVFRPKVGTPSQILLEVIQRPTVLADAYGPGSHVFLEEGATLKIAGNSVSGINKTSFDATWAVTDAEGNITRPARPPSPNFYSLERFQKALRL